MRKIILSVLLSSFFLFPLTLQAKQAPRVSSDYSKPILVRATRRVVSISLVSNRTTGYSWFLESYNHEFIKPLSYHYQAPNAHIVGAPGISRWTFKVEGDAFEVPRILHIVMIYTRPWDLKNAKKKVITLITQPES